MATGMLTLKEPEGILTSIRDQAKDDIGPITLINTFVIPSMEAVPAFLTHWEVDASAMKKQPGFIQAQLYRNAGEKSNVFVNAAVWESTAAFRSAQQNPEFRESLRAYPEGTVATPIVMTKVAVPGICTT